jgi:hypothetical protein
MCERSSLCSGVAAVSRNSASAEVREEAIGREERRAHHRSAVTRSAEGPGENDEMNASYDKGEILTPQRKRPPENRGALLNLLRIDFDAELELPRIERRRRSPARQVDGSVGLHNGLTSPTLNLLVTLNMSAMTSIQFL